MTLIIQEKLCIPSNWLQDTQLRITRADGGIWNWSPIWYELFLKLLILYSGQFFSFTDRQAEYAHYMLSFLVLKSFWSRFNSLNKGVYFRRRITSYTWKSEAKILPCFYVSSSKFFVLQVSTKQNTSFWTTYLHFILATAMHAVF